MRDGQVVPAGFGGLYGTHFLVAAVLPGGDTFVADKFGYIKGDRSRLADQGVGDEVGLYYRTTGLDEPYVIEVVRVVGLPVGAPGVFTLGRIGVGVGVSADHEAAVVGLYDLGSQVVARPVGAARATVGLLPDFHAALVEVEYPKIAGAIVRGVFPEGEKVWIRLALAHHEVIADTVLAHAVAPVFGRAAVAALPLHVAPGGKFHDPDIIATVTRTLLVAALVGAGIARHEVAAVLGFDEVERCLVKVAAQGALPVDAAVGANAHQPPVVEAA